MKHPKKQIHHRNPGVITSYFSGVARVTGLEKTLLHEVLADANGVPVALVVGFDEQAVSALFFEDQTDVTTTVYRTGEVFMVPVGVGHIGRVVNGLGQPIDGLGAVTGEYSSVFSKSPQIIDRKPVTRPLTTGIKIIDTCLPIGRGQRELIIGDRKLGKSTMGLDTVLNQRHASPPVYCVYVVCGQKKQRLREIISLFEKYNTFLYSVIVAATAEDSFAKQYLAPFTGCRIAEYFRDAGNDALIVYDDLSKHAKSYRDIALLQARPPGREAYPGDIFSLHAGLLERAAQLSDKEGGGSLTALPIVETQEGDISTFIPTNLISITDGQIYLERGLFQKGFIPAVNVGLSVSRVGSQAQPPQLRDVVKSIRLALAQHKELQKLTQLETVVSAETQANIHRGDLTLELLKQQKQTNITWPEQVILFYAVEEGYFDDIDQEKWRHMETLLLELMRNRYFDMLKSIQDGSFHKQIKQKVEELVQDYKEEFTLS